MAKDKNNDFTGIGKMYGYSVKGGEIDPSTGLVTNKGSELVAFDEYSFTLAEIALKFGERLQKDFNAQIKRMKILMESGGLPPPYNTLELVHILLSDIFRQKKGDSINEFNKALSEDDFILFGHLMQKAFKRRISYLESIRSNANVKHQPPVNQTRLDMEQKGRALAVHKAYIIRLAESQPRNIVLTKGGYCSKNFLNLPDVRKYINEHELYPDTVKNWVKKHYSKNS
jgi:hypothetical protein